MKSHNREIIVYYDPDSNSGKMTAAYARSLSQNVIVYSYDQAPPTITGWRMILNSLAVNPKDLLDKSMEYYQNEIQGRDFDDEGWLNVIKRNPKLIKYPIAIHGKRAVFCQTPTDILKLIPPRRAETDYEK